MGVAIVDASAIVEAFVGRKPDPELRRRVITTVVVAPEIIDVEVLNVLRRLERAGTLSSLLANEATTQLARTPIIRTTHRPLLGRLWQLRHSVRAYDATYVALAEQLDAPLVTCDAKLAGSHGHGARVELYPAS